MERQRVPKMDEEHLIDIIDCLRWQIDDLRDDNREHRKKIAENIQEIKEIKEYIKQYTKRLEEKRNGLQGY